MLKKVALALVGLIVLIIVLGVALPRRWRVERSVVIDAPSTRIHPFLNDLRRWQDWSVWTRELDPIVRNTFEGPQDGVGAKWSWMGPQMGRGRMEIIASDPLTGLSLDEAIEADEVNARAVFTYTSVAASTRVTWVDEGTLPPVMGGYFRGMVEDLLGENLEKGLARLKTVVEALPPPPANVRTPTVAALDGGDTVDAGDGALDAGEGTVDAGSTLAAPAADAGP